MKLSKNFELSELVKSQTAVRLGIPNQPNSAQISNLKNLCEKILQPVRLDFGQIAKLFAIDVREFCLDN